MSDIFAKNLWQTKAKVACSQTLLFLRQASFSSLGVKKNNVCEQAKAKGSCSQKVSNREIRNLLGSWFTKAFCADSSEIICSFFVIVCAVSIIANFFAQEINFLRKQSGIYTYPCTHARMKSALLL